MSAYQSLPENLTFKGVYTTLEERRQWIIGALQDEQVAADEMLRDHWTEALARCEEAMRALLG